MGCGPFIRPIRAARISGAKRARAWCALLLAVLVALPGAASGQAPGQGPMGPMPAPDAGPEITPPGRAPAQRTPQESAHFPTVTIVEPRSGSIVTREDQRIVIAFQDPRDEIDLASFRVWINGVDRTREFQVSGREASWQPRQVLQDGQNTVVASIRNLAGNLTTASGFFVLDKSVVVTARATPRSPLERAFLQPPSAPPAERALRTAPTEPTVSRDLTQFGYETFRTLLPAMTPAANLPVSPDYVLGPGDVLILYVWNIPGTALYDSATLTIDRTGSAFVPRVGSIPLQGLTLAQAQEVIRGRIARNYSGFDLRVALGELRAISVYVVGEVARPGTYTISPFSTVLDALFVAGGPTKMGSLRSVRVAQNGQTVREVDLYDFLLRGDRPTGPMLQSGDTVFVPSIGPVAAVAGEVKRPAIYELRGGTTVGTLVAMAGGVLPTAQLGRIQVERSHGSTGRVILDLALGAGRGGESELLQDGDLVTVFPGQDHLRNAVTLEGYVRLPGKYEWKPGMRLRDILTQDMLLPEAYRKRVEITRVRPDFSREVLAVDLQDGAPGAVVDPARDLALNPQDKITVHSEVLGPATITLTGEVRRPGRYSITPGERLSGILERAGGFLPTAFPRGSVFTRETLRERERLQMERFVQTQVVSTLAESSAVAAGAAESGRPEAAATQAGISAQRRELLQSLTQVVTLGRLAIRLDTPDNLRGTAEDIELEDGDSLHVPPRPTSVSILGAVRNNTAVLHKPGENIEYYLGRAGGATREADVDQIYLLKADGSALASFVKMRQVEAGDAVVVPLSVEPRYRTLTVLKDVATIIGNIAIPFGVIAGLLK